MSELGSGRYSHSGVKKKTEDSLPLDIRKLQRSNYLTSGHKFNLQWSISDNAIASIQVMVEVTHVLLTYRYRPLGENEWQNVKQKIYMTDTCCTFGGTRPWWLCPACNNRTAILYSNGKRYACRLCHKLAYTSQSKSIYDRALTQAQKIRTRLGGTVNMMLPFPQKPKGMHKITYERVKAEHDALDKVTLVGLAQWVDKLEKRRE